MNPLLTVAIVVALAVCVVLFLRSRIAKEWNIQPSEIPQLISKLKSAGGQLAWAQVIAVIDPDQKDSDIALDYSVSNGEFQFNWCLLAPKNLEDKQILIEFFNKNGFSQVEMVAENGCPLIKVTGTNLEGLANRILTEIYHFNDSLTLIGEGFDWP